MVGLTQRQAMCPYYEMISLMASPANVFYYFIFVPKVAVASSHDLCFRVLHFVPAVDKFSKNIANGPYCCQILKDPQSVNATPSSAVVSQALTIIPATQEKGSAGMEVQSVWHKASLFTKAQAAAWCDAHNFKSNVYASREDAGTLTHHIHRQFETAEAVDGSWRTLSNDFPEGVSVSICERKKSMEIKHIKGAQDANDPFRFVMSDESVDRVGDVIRAKGWDLEDFQKNPVALWGHDHAKPIGVWENVAVVGKKLIGNLRLAKKGTSPEIDTIRSLVEQRILKSVSVGFQPLEAVALKNKSGFEYLSQKLHECSLVSVPANANALAIAKSFGADPVKVFGGAKPLTQCAAKATKEATAVLEQALKQNAQFLEKRK